MAQAFANKMLLTALLTVFSLLCCYWEGVLQKKKIEFPKPWQARIGLFMKVWGIVFLVSLLYGILRQLVPLTILSHSNFNLLVPMLIGAFCCKKILQAHHEK